MASQELANLTSDCFEAEYAFISNPKAVHRALQRSEEVKQLRTALNSGTVPEPLVREFCIDLLRTLEYGKRFPDELALAAVAVTLENRPTAFAREFVTELARLELSEMPVAIRVAREAEKELGKLSGNKTKVILDTRGAFMTSMGSLSTEWQLMAKSLPTGVDEERHVLQGAS
jgi:hypothetical protein